MYACFAIWVMLVIVHVFFIQSLIFQNHSHKKNTKKNRMKALYAAVTEAREAGTGRRLCDLFMVKPSKKDYPDYYQVILEPMDLRTIESNIRAERYVSEEALINDMMLMFRNARHYNEEASQVGQYLYYDLFEGWIMTRSSLYMLFYKTM